MLTWAILAIENESDREFIERLYTQNYAVMLQKAKGILKNAQRAEDVVEAVMLKLIDRIDLLEQDGKRMVRVVDYKTGTPPDLPNARNIGRGTTLQLITYLIAVLSIYENAVPAGANHGTFGPRRRIALSPSGAGSYSNRSAASGEESVRGVAPSA